MTSIGAINTQATADLSAQVDRLTGRTSEAEHPPSIGPQGEGNKFAPDGSPNAFPGNTFICHLDPSSDGFGAIRVLQRGLSKGPAGSYFTFLPPSSFHMTIFPGFCGNPLGDDGWPDDMPRDASLSNVTQHFLAKMPTARAFSGASVKPLRFHNGFSPEFTGFTEQDSHSLWTARKTLEDLTTIRRPDFASYRFHVSIAYQRAWMPEDVARTHLHHSALLFEDFTKRISHIDLGSIEFCSFETMHHFETLTHVPTK